MATLFGRPGIKASARFAGYIAKNKLAVQRLQSAQMVEDLSLLLSGLEARAPLNTDPVADEFDEDFGMGLWPWAT